MVVFIAGKKGEGKTTFLSRTAYLLKAQGWSLHGFISNPVNQHEQRIAYYIKDINSEETRLLCNKIPEETNLPLGSFYFKKSGISFGEKLVNNGIKKGSSQSIFVIDEIGRLELQGYGWNNILKKIIANNVDLLCAVRTPFMEEVIHYYQPGFFRIFNLANSTPGEVANALAEIKKI